MIILYSSFLSLISGIVIGFYSKSKNNIMFGDMIFLISILIIAGLYSIYIEKNMDIFIFLMIGLSANYTMYSIGILLGNLIDKLVKRRTYRE